MKFSFFLLLLNSSSIGTAFSLEFGDDHHTIPRHKRFVKKKNIFKKYFILFIHTFSLVFDFFIVLVN